MFIAFSGVDCAGKSTQIKLLADTFRLAGHPVKTVWHRPGYSAALDGARIWARKLLKRGRNANVGKVLPNATDTAARAAAFSRPGVTEAWISLALADTAMIYGGMIRWWRARGNVVISDRYLLDAALDLSFRFPHRARLTDKGFSMLSHGCPHPDVHLVLVLPYQDMLERMAIKKEPFPDPPSVRDARYAAYVELSQRPGLTCIDASGTIADVHSRIVVAIEMQMGSFSC